MRFVKLASPADAARLQQLLERCSDYYELHEGCPTPADAGEYELTSIPSMLEPEDLHVFALADADGTLHAMTQLLRNLPKPGDWWIGLLVVAPESRGQGIGGDLLRQAIELVGATVIRLAVSVDNPRGQRFWESAGFRETGELVKVTARNGHVDTVRILSRGV